VDAADITRPVRDRDRRIEALEDLVLDLLALAVRGGHCCADGYARAEVDAETRHVTRAAIAHLHTSDCAVHRAAHYVRERQT